MVSITKPQVRVFQEFLLVPTEATDPLRAHISGPNAILHRYDDATEKATILVGEYDPEQDTCYLWPERAAGGLVDYAYTKVLIDDALLMYHEDLLDDSSGGRGTVTCVANRSNWIRSSTLEYKANGTEYPRSSLFGDRDVAVGDVVYLRGVEDPTGTCIEHELWTTVAGFSAEAEVGSVGQAREEDDNQDTVAASTTATFISGPVNCLTLELDGTDYDGLESGYVCETYTLDVVRSTVSGCDASRIRVTSASGTDDVADVAAAIGEWFDIGTRGLQGRFVTGSGACEDTAEDAGVAANELVVGQKYEAEVCQAFERPCAVSTGDYAGEVDDVYVVTVTKGGLWADLPEITVTTTKGLDFSGPTTITGYDVEFPVGTNGVGIKFVDCLNDEPDGEYSESVGDGVIAGLRTGDKYYITCLSPSNGAIRTLILDDDVPEEIRDATDLDLRLYMKRDIEVTQDRVSNPPLVNWETEETQICLKLGMTAYESSWTKLGVPQPLPIKGGSVFIHYREFVPNLANRVTGISDVSELDVIPGQLHKDNPLKYGVYKALSNSAGTVVYFTAVTDPSNIDRWQDVLERVDGREDMYNFVPLTWDSEVIKLFQAHVGAESGPDANNWKGMFTSLKVDPTVMLVGKSSADDQILRPTSLDGGEVLATIKDDPQATGVQYTRLSVPARNSNFILYGVVPGDQVRFNFTIDAFGNTTYRTATVDQVISASSLRLTATIGEAINQAQKIEIWHTRSAEEVKDALKNLAQSYADRRVCATWPDYLGDSGQTVEGYFLGAGLAGLVSSVAPHQGLTNVEVKGFDDYARSTNYFSATQLDSLQDGGVWIVTEDRDGTPHTYHGLTTNTVDLNRQEEMVRRNVDSISYFLYRQLRPYIGRTNVVPSFLSTLQERVRAALKVLSEVTIEDLGAQITSWEIVRFRQHPLFADKIEIVIRLVVPAPTNTIDLSLVI